MKKRDFRELLEKQWSRGKFVCVGLDSDHKKLPRHLKREHEDPYEELLSFNFPIIRQTSDIVGFYKLNAAPYQMLGVPGERALRRTIEMIHSEFPRVVVILDSKDTDIGKTNEWYVEMAFDHYKADAVTVNPYFGMKALEPFLDRKDRGIIVLCRTSNPGADEFQDVCVNIGGRRMVPLYHHVAESVALRWNENGNCGLVVGATAPEELGLVREIVGDGFPILIPGIGTQGGDLDATVKAGKDSRGSGMIINSSSAIIFASSGEDFAEAARSGAQKLHDGITNCLAAMA